MKYDPAKHHRRSIRLKGYDYSQPGAYFVSVCTQGRACLFGDVVDGEMRLNAAGQVVKDCWRAIPDHFPHVRLDEFVIMPNHVHEIVIIVGATHASPLQLLPEPSPHASPQPSPLRCGPKSCSIAAIVGSFKSAVTKRINALRQTPGVPVWQRNYYEHIIRNDESLNSIREYIINNPLQWEVDRENPDIVGARCNVPLQKDEPWRI